jgi:hypothetical protein
LLSGSGSVPDANVAAGSQTVIAGTLAIASGTGSASNYTLTGGVHSGTVTTAALSVTADNQSRAYGAANPSFTYTITGYVNGETYATAGVTGSASASTTATSTSAAGSYPITTSTGTLAASNYSFSATNGVLTVTGTSISDSALPRLTDSSNNLPLAELCITPANRTNVGLPGAPGQGFMLRTASAGNAASANADSTNADSANPDSTNPGSHNSHLPQGRMFFSRKPATCVVPKVQPEPEQSGQG